MLLWSRLAVSPSLSIWSFSWLDVCQASVPMCSHNSLAWNMWLLTTQLPCRHLSSVTTGPITVGGNQEQCRYHLLFTCGPVSFPRLGIRSIVSGRTVAPELQVRKQCQRHGLPVGNGSVIQEGHVSAPLVFMTQHCTWGTLTVEG